MQVKTYQFDKEDKANAGAQVDQKTRKFMMENKGVSYEDAMQTVLEEDEDLSKRYFSIPEAIEKEYSDAPKVRSYSAAAKSIDDQVQEHIFQFNLDYETALKRVLSLPQNIHIASKYLAGDPRNTIVEDED